MSWGCFSHTFRRSKLRRKEHNPARSVLIRLPELAHGEIRILWNNLLEIRSVSNKLMPQR